VGVFQQPVRPLLRRFADAPVYLSVVIPSVLTIWSLNLPLWQALLATFPTIDCFRRVLYASRSFARLRVTIPTLDEESILSIENGVTLLVPVILHDNVNCERLAMNVRCCAKQEKTIRRVILLTDFPDSCSRSASPSENGLLSRLVAEMQQSFADALTTWEILHRDRVMGDNGVYTGWERKRGKVVKFCESVSSGTCAFNRRYGHEHALNEIDVVFVMDEDSRPLARSVDILYLAHEHPLNRSPDNDHQNKYGVMVPGVVVTQRESGWKISDWMRDIGSKRFAFNYFGETAYSGKGLFSVRTFLDRGCTRIPEGRVLSHDTVEGYMLRPAFLARSAMSESDPSDYFAYTARLHRWARGDLQNLIFGRSFAKRPFCRSHLADLALIRLTQVALPAALVCLLLEGHLLFALFVVLAPWIAATLSCFVGLFVPSLHFLGCVVRLTLTNIRAEAIRILTCGHQACLVAHALGTVIYRSITKRNLLEWTPMSEGTNRTRRLARDTLLSSSLLSLAVLTALVLGKYGSHTSITIALLLSWVLFPFAMLLVSPPKTWARDAAAENERAY
jgi:cyclic beta-1,2-glucan synthetase